MSKAQTLTEIKHHRDLRDRAMRLAAQMLFSRRWDAAMNLVREAQEHGTRADELTADALGRFYVTVNAAA